MVLIFQALSEMLKRWRAGGVWGESAVYRFQSPKKLKMESRKQWNDEIMYVSPSKIFIADPLISHTDYIRIRKL